MNHRARLWLKSSVRNSKNQDLKKHQVQEPIRICTKTPRKSSHPGELELRDVTKKKKVPKRLNNSLLQMLIIRNILRQWTNLPNMVSELEDGQTIHKAGTKWDLQCKPITYLQKLSKARNGTWVWSFRITDHYLSRTSTQALATIILISKEIRLEVIFLFRLKEDMLWQRSWTCPAPVHINCHWVTKRWHLDLYLDLVLKESHWRNPKPLALASTASLARLQKCPSMPMVKINNSSTSDKFNDWLI